MATFRQSTIEKGSDTVQDYLCSTCEDMKLEESADFHCESCMKFYCRRCINIHDQLFTKHCHYGREDMKKWPVSKKAEDFLRKCVVHKDKNLKMFCQDHSQLCCNTCAFANHRQCKTVTLLSDYVNYNSTDLQQQSDSIQTILEEMKTLQDSQEAYIRSVQSSYEEQVLQIHETRREINETLNLIEKKTLNEMKGTLTKLQSSLKGTVDKCETLRDELKRLRDAMQDICDKSNMELSFIASRKCQDKIPQAEAYLKENSVQVQVSITFEPNIEIVQYLSTQSGLGRIANSTKTLPLQGESGPGEGFSAMVCKGTYRLPDSKQIPVAVKMLKQNDPNEEFDLLEEAKIMVKLSHKHIVGMIGVCKAENLMLVLELCPLGKLNKFLSAHRNFPQADIVLLLWQVAMGMAFLESKKIIHRDLSARNVLLFTESCAKIFDFGMSKALSPDDDYYEVLEASQWPLRWYAPECVYYWKFDSSSDVWSYGVTLWEAMSYGEKPYKGKRGQEILKFLVEEEKRMEKPPLCDQDVYDVMLSCWEYDKVFRPTFAQIVTTMGDIHKLMLKRKPGTFTLKL